MNKQTKNSRESNSIKEKLFLIILSTISTIVTTFFGLVITSSFNQHIVPLINPKALAYDINEPAKLKNKTTISYLYTIYLWNTGSSTINNFNICFDTNRIKIVNFNDPQEKLKKNSVPGKCAIKFDVKAFDYRKDNPYQISLYTSEEINPKDHLNIIDIKAEEEYGRQIPVQKVNSVEPIASQIMKLIFIILLSGLISSLLTFNYINYKLKKAQINGKNIINFIRASFTGK